MKSCGVQSHSYATCKQQQCRLCSLPSTRIRNDKIARYSATRASDKTRRQSSTWELLYCQSDNRTETQAIDEAETRTDLDQAPLGLRVRILLTKWMSLHHCCQTPYQGYYDQVSGFCYGWHLVRRNRVKGYLEWNECTVCLNIYSGFGGLEVVCWPLVPKFVGSHPQRAFLPTGSKAVGRSHVVALRHVKCKCKV